MDKLRGHFLAELALAHDMTRSAELGLWKGRTFSHMLKTCPKLTIIGVDAWRRRPENEGKPGGQSYKKHNMGGLKKHVMTNAMEYGRRAVVLNMDTVEAASFVPDGSLDLVFIDADHTSEAVRRDIEAWRPKVKAGGFLSGHDIDWESVRSVVDEMVPGYDVGPDNVWLARC